MSIKETAPLSDSGSNYSGEASWLFQPMKPKSAELLQEAWKTGLLKSKQPMHLMDFLHLWKAQQVTWGYITCPAQWGTLTGCFLHEITLAGLRFTGEGRSSLTLWNLKKFLSRKNPKYWQGRKKTLFDWLSLWIVMRKCTGAGQEQAQVRDFPCHLLKGFCPEITVLLVQVIISWGKI